MTTSPLLIAIALGIMLPTLFFIPGYLALRAAREHLDGVERAICAVLLSMAMTDIGLSVSERIVEPMTGIAVVITLGVATIVGGVIPRIARGFAKLRRCVRRAPPRRSA